MSRRKLGGAGRSDPVERGRESVEADRVTPSRDGRGPWRASDRVERVRSRTDRQGTITDGDLQRNAALGRDLGNEGRTVRPGAGGADESSQQRRPGRDAV